jgi:Uma2 family endonuclease
MTVVVAPHRRSWSRAEYERLIALGFFAGQRVERIEGAIIQMTPMLGPHATALGLMTDALTPHIGAGLILRAQLPLALGPDSDPEPDSAIVAGGWRDDAAGHPTTALLVIEIADSSLAHDRTTEARSYARAGVADYWIVNLAERQVEVSRSPEREPSHLERWRYRAHHRAQPGDHLAPPLRPTVAIAVDDVPPWGRVAASPRRAGVPPMGEPASASRRSASWWGGLSAPGRHRCISTTAQRTRPAMHRAPRGRWRSTPPRRAG